MNETLDEIYYTTADIELVAYWNFQLLEDMGMGGDGLVDDIRDLSVNNNHLDLNGDAHLEISEDLPLPVELSSFTAFGLNGQIVLQWTTQSELDNLGFTRYRPKEENGNYTEIAFFKDYETLTGHRNCSYVNHYSFIDEFVEPDYTYYYKLYITDINGLKILLGIVTATPSQNIDHALIQNYPNPFNS